MQRLAKLASHVAPTGLSCGAGLAGHAAATFSGARRAAAAACSSPAAAAPPATEPAVLYDLRGHVATLTLNRAANRNAMTLELLEGVRAAAARAAADPQVRCVVVTGRGRNFCGGADFKGGGLQFADYQDASVTAGQMVGPERSLAMYNHFLALLDLGVPVIGALQGHAIGGGMGLALCCDMRVCHGASQYGVNFVRLGLHPGMASTYFLPRLVGVPRAAELLLTGRLVDGWEAGRLGLANYCCETPEEVLAKANALADEVAMNAPVAVRWTKRSLYKHLGWSPRDAAWEEAGLQLQTAATADAQEGARALLEKRRPSFEGR